MAGADRYDDAMDHETRLKLFDTVRAEQGAFLEAVLWRLTGHRELFVEALQESLLQVWRHVEKLQGHTGRAYVYRIAQSAASQAWRKRVASGADVLDDHESSAARPDVRELTEADRLHIAIDMKRVYVLLTAEWLDYMKHLRENYPYLFSFAMRTNPFDPSATPEIR